MPNIIAKIFFNKDWDIIPVFELQMFFRSHTSCGKTFEDPPVLPVHVEHVELSGIKKGAIGALSIVIRAYATRSKRIAE